MRALIVVVVLLCVAAGAWLLRDRWAGTSQSGIRVPPQARQSAAPATRAATPDAPASAGAQHRAEVRAQAERYVATLTRPDPAPVRAEQADHFVTGDQMLTLVPDAEVESTTVARMQADPELAPDTPITVVREVEQVERVTPEKLIAQSGGDLDKPVMVLENDHVRETTVREVLEQASRTPDVPIDVVTRVEYYEQTTPRELAESGAQAPDAPIRVIRGHRGAEASSVRDLMRSREIKAGSLFYVRTVRASDRQGIWGIVHDGIIENFARGMAIRRGKEINTYRVDIPRDADELRPDASSSYLGKLIFEKTRSSHVYNFAHHRMGQNPDRIFPGQEIVIVDFQPDELIEIYRHFVEQRG